MVDGVDARCIRHHIVKALVAWRAAFPFLSPVSSLHCHCPPRSLFSGSENTYVPRLVTDIQSFCQRFGVAQQELSRFFLYLA
jgi:hypothetical protein